MRKTLLVTALVAFASPAFAQATQRAKEADPTNKVAGGVTVPGWKGRIDPQAAAQGMKLADAKFAPMGKDIHITSGPAAIYYNPKDAVKGDYTVTASFSQTKAPSHPEAYGLFVGGANLEDPTQSYVYFLTRGDGKYLINHRAGADIHKIVDWTDTDATVKQDAAGKATNVLSIRATKDSVTFLANGKPVRTFSKAEMHGFSAEGQTGIRVNHNLDVHVAGFQVKKAK